MSPQMNNTKKNNSHKISIIKEIQMLTKQYLQLVESLQSIFLTINEKKQIEAEIKILEQTLKSKMFISEQMKGY